MTTEPTPPVKKPRQARTSGYKGRRTAFEILNRVMLSGGYSNVLSTKILSDEKLSPEDRHAATNLVYGVLRNLSYIDEIFRSKTSKGKLNVSPQVLNLGRMAIFEMVFLDRIPNYAAVSEYVRMAAKAGGQTEKNFLNACLRKVNRSDRTDTARRVRDPLLRLAVRNSHPIWMVRELVDAYGLEDTRKILAADNSPMQNYFRLNTTRISLEDFLSATGYQHIGFASAPSPAACVIFAQKSGAFPKQYLDAGWVTPQDRSTQFVPYYLEPKPGERILDLCCGVGIKTAQILEMTGCGCEITAVDIFGHKLESLRSECARLGLTGVTTLETDATATALPGGFDRVMLDAPCTGSGSVRHRPEIKYRINPADVESMAQKQSGLLEAAAKSLRPGGTLLYSTCSMLRAENDDQVRRFLAAHPEFRHVTPDVESRIGFDVSGFSRTDFGTTLLPNMTDSCAAFVSVLQKM